MASKEQRAERTQGDRRAERVLSAARELFFERGYRGTTMQQIAKRAGYSKRTAYLDYRNKDELFISVCAEGGALLLEKLQAVPVAELSIEDGIESYLDVYIRFSREDRGYFRMIFNESTPDIIECCSPAVASRVGEIERACLGVVADWVERAIAAKQLPDVDPWETAGIIVGSVTGIILMTMAGSQSVYSQTSLESLARKAIWAYWRGLRLSGDGGPK